MLALEQWLEGEDATALSAFSTLAQNDNRAAEVFLGQIGSMTYLHFHLTADMPRRDRIALMRSPGGLSGTSWLSIAAEDEPMAQALTDRRGTGTALQATRALLDLGETRAAFMGMLRLRNGDGGEYYQILPDLLTLTSHPGIAAEGRWFGFDLLKRIEWILENDPSAPINAEQFRAGAERLFATGPFPDAIRENWRDIELSGPFGRDTSPEDWLVQGAFMASEPLLSRIAATCAETCPDAQETCMYMLNRVTPVPVYFYGHSPAEWAVSTNTYRAATRFDADIVRAATSSTGASEVEQSGRDFSVCEIPYSDE